MPWDDPYGADGPLGRLVTARGMAGAAKSHLFEAQDLVRFGVTWIERHLRD